MYEIGLVIKPVTDSLLAILFMLLVGLLPALLIYLNAPKLHYFYLFTQFGHLALLGAAGKYLNNKKISRETRMLLQDDETFFAIYPKEKKRDERIKARHARRLEKITQRRMRQQEKEHIQLGL
ncbi:MAG: hypothetical protein IKI69_06540 [Oscillospiraceae bacterium]|nr:hypothetical protein [Oscillospiraceae bacterium]